MSMARRLAKKLVRDVERRDRESKARLATEREVALSDTGSVTEFACGVYLGGLEQPAPSPERTVISVTERELVVWDEGIVSGKDADVPIGRIPRDAITDVATEDRSTPALVTLILNVLFTDAEGYQRRAEFRFVQPGTLRQAEESFRRYSGT